MANPASKFVLGPLSPLSLYVPSAGITDGMPHLPSIYVSYGNLNSGPHTYTSNTLPIEPPPQCVLSFDRVLLSNAGWP